MAAINNNTRLTVEEAPKVEKLKENQEDTRSSFLPYLKCFVAGFICLAVLSCAVFSKISVIAVAEKLNSDKKDNGRVFIMLTLILMVPQFVSFLGSAWGSLRYRNRPWPTKKAILIGVICSILEVVGLCIFTMITLSSDVKVYGNESIAVMNCVSIIPTFWQIWKLHRQQTSLWRRVCFFLCGVVQTAGLVVIIIFNESSGTRKYTVLSLLLISVAWAPKMRKWQMKPRLGPGEQNEPELDDENLVHPGEFLHRKNARTKATMISEGLKLLLTPFVGFLVSWLFGLIEPSDLHPGFIKLGNKHDEIFQLFLVNIFLSFGGYLFGTLACSMAIQKIGFALPLSLTTPLSFLMVTLPFLCSVFQVKCDSDWDDGLPIVVCVVIWLAQFLSMTYYVWKSQDFIMAKESQLFWVPSYNGVLLEQNLLLNRKNELTDEFFVNQNKLAKDSCIFICTTMYHEADYEMEQLLYSLHRVDNARGSIDNARESSMRRIESHIWFDGAVKRDVLNSYVLQLISLVSKTMNVRVNACMKYETPYGMELRWRLPGGMNFHIHLKDNIKVKNKKRWSQVMYMSYVLDFKTKQLEVREEDTYILTTDADIMFNADSVEALLDLMMRDPKVGAVCGRTHPLGNGPLVWYQIFDYAIGHWFQKVANHVLGSVLCCPGCFSVYRAKALRDVLPLYASTADHAVDFLTKDMGEDRWLCTLMVQAGWRLEYCAAAQNRTYCPDNFDEFYKQRRRWIPSTLANLSLLISEWSLTVSNSDTVSFPFILYQAANVFSTLISPATVILIVVGGLQYGWNLDSITVLVLLLIVTFLFGLVCLFTSQDFQLKTAKVLTLIFALLMGAVLVGLLEQVAENPAGDTEPTKAPTTHTYPTYKPKTTKKTTTKPSADSFYNQFVSHSPHNAVFVLNTSFSDSPLFASSPTPTHIPTNHSTIAPSKKPGLFSRFAVSSWYLFALVGIYILTALCHPTEAYCVLHGVWYLLCLPSGYLFLVIYSVCNLTDRSWGTRENKTKTESGESLLKLIGDKIIWLCHGCKDTEPLHEPPVAPINGGEETSVTESSESDNLASLNEDNAETKQVESITGNETDDDSPQGSHDSPQGSHDSPRGSHDSPQGSHDTTEPARPCSPTPSSKLPTKSALKKGGKFGPSSPGNAGNKGFRFPGEKTVHFPSKLPTSKTQTPVADWLDGKMKQYIPNFEDNGYDDTSFIAGMNEEDLNAIGIEKRGHRKNLLQEIEQLPLVELDNNVPDRVDKWLSDLGLHDYWLAFKNNKYDNPKALEDLKVMNKSDLNTVVAEDFGVHKRGHFNKLLQAIKKLQYPSAIQRRIREARVAMSAVPLRPLKDDNDQIEFDFWTKLRELRLLPESKAFGQHSELSEKLADLRDSVVLCLLVANLLWIILIFSLSGKADLNVAKSNPLGLSFLAVFGFIIVIQFLTMLWHRMSTLSHVVARAPYRAGATSLKVWSFHNDDLPPAPSEEELARIRRKRSKKRRRSAAELLQSQELSRDEERPLLHNGGRNLASYATTSRSSPLPV